MIVEQIWTENDYRNFNYLIACPDTGEALAIDPLAYDQVLAVAKDKGWQVTQVLNTHHHRDLCQGDNRAVEMGTKIAVPNREADLFENAEAACEDQAREQQRCTCAFKRCRHS